MRESNAKKLVISVTAVMLSAALLFVFLYRYDNKYTHGTPQPGVRIFFCKLSFCGKIYIFQGRAFVLPSYNIS